MSKNKRKNRNRQKKKPYKKQSTYFIRDKYFIALIIVLVLLVLNIGILIYYQKQEKEKNKELQRKIDQLEEKQQQIQKIKYGDIIFLGDSITEWYDLEKYYNFPIVNSGVAGWTTDDILENLDEKVFSYEAKKLFLLIGTNDMVHDKDEEYIVNNIQKIINQIKKENNNVEIYIESIYPVNNTDHKKINHSIVSNRTNDEIININKSIKQLCSKNHLTYINMYDLLVDKNGELNLDYTKEGLHINDKGYQVITKKILEYI